MLPPFADRLMDRAQVLARPAHRQIQMSDRNTVGDVKRVSRRLPLAPEIDVGVGAIVAPFPVGVRHVEEPRMLQRLELFRPQQRQPEMRGGNRHQIGREGLARHVDRPTGLRRVAHRE